MSKNRWWVTALVGILILVVLAGVGYAMYRLGYAQGAQVAAGNQELPRNLQGQQNFRHPNLDLRGFERGITPFTRGVGGMMGFAWMGIILRIAIPLLIVVGPVLLILFLIGKLGWKRQSQKAPVEIKPEAGDQEHNQQ